MTPKSFGWIGSCIRNPFPTVEELSEVIESAREITWRTFSKWCDAPDKLREFRILFPHNYTFYKSRFRGLVIYFYEWSRIENFYAHGGWSDGDWLALYNGGPRGTKHEYERR